MRSGYSAYNVISRIYVCRPVAQRLIHRIFKRARSRFHRDDRRAKQLHTVDIRRLSLNIFSAHVDEAFKTEARGDCSASNTVLAGASLGNYARLAHSLREECLTDSVIHLVCAGVVEVFTLEVNACATCRRCEPLG